MTNYKELSKDELINLVEVLKIDPTYGVYSRASLELSPPQGECIIFWDIDNMHTLNAELSYQGVDEKIKRVCRRIREVDGHLRIIRWYSGDEFIYSCNNSDALGAANRILSMFAAEGIGITVGVASVKGDQWLSAVTRASSFVQRAKFVERRGTINYF